MEPRVEGATLPGLTATVTDDNNATITDGTSYTWTCQASLKVAPGTAPAQLWVKTTGITATASGFTCVWLDADIGTLTAVSNRVTTYLLEFNGTKSGGGLLKHQETVDIKPQIP